jgi:uncharacterized membrane protein
MERFRTILRWLLAAAYLTAGVVHLRSPETFIPIVPDWVPFPAQTVLFTGACEIAGAIALLTRRLRYVAGVMLALYAVCVFPANIKHALDGVAIGGSRLGWWYHAPRLAFQPVIVWWALFAGQVIDWPFRFRATSYPRS